MSYILGLDLGVQSIGWAIITKNTLTKLGVRCFDSGTGSEKEIEEGKDESRNVARRNARLIRRNLWRRKRRVLKVFNILRNNALLPIGCGIGDSPEQRQELINKLDVDLSREFLPTGDRVAGHLLPYKLRAMALDVPLSPFAFGRALLHLAQRRGFLSNKKTQGKSDEDQGQIKEAIKELAETLEAEKFRTLGEYFASLDPEEQRIRQRWTGRKMFTGEFDKIWEAQCRLNPGGNLTDELRDKVYHALFFQRPLKSQKHLIGKCELEPKNRRASMASLEAQRFRFWQKILDLKYRNQYGEITELTRVQQDILAENLEQTGKLSFSAMKKLLGFSKKKDMHSDAFKFNLEMDGDEDAKGGIKGNTTSAKIADILGEKWWKVSEEMQTHLVNEMLSFDDEDALARRLQKAYKFNADLASQLARVSLEPDYTKLSRKAIRRILPFMIQWRIPFATARKEIYGEQMDTQREQTCDILPPILQAKPQLRNPVVSRTLTELRKVVNAIIRKYGKPEMIRIELARDMKKGRKEREKITKENKQRETQRANAVQAIIKETKGQAEDVKSGDILKYLLAEECNWECPYSGKTITPGNLLGATPSFDIEHILPFSRSLDNSFVNKTLCDSDENRHTKRNRTPYEAYSGDPDKWHAIKVRVGKFRGKTADAKLRRFLMEEIPADFTSRMLNDTRYISKVACEYLGLLYGGQFDANGRQRIQVSTGRTTSFLRGEWDMNSILGDGDEKNRTDHRHHAVDAAVIAMCGPKTVQLLERSAERASEFGTHRLFVKGGIEEPIQDFRQGVRQAVAEINVSFRCNRKVSGQLHDGSNYSKPHFQKDEKGKPVEYRCLRKPLFRMSKGEIEEIVDKRVRELVQEKIEQLGGDMKKLEHNLPLFHGRPIRSARFRKKISIVTVGEGHRKRHVALANNHHIEIIAVLNEKGEECNLEWKMVTVFDAYKRNKQKEPVITRDFGPDKILKFSLAKGEYVLATIDGEDVLLRVNGISENDLSFSLHTDARTIKDRKETGDFQKYRIRSLKRFQELKIRKVSVDLLGVIHPAND